MAPEPAKVPALPVGICTLPTRYFRSLRYGRGSIATSGPTPRWNEIWNDDNAGGEDLEFTDIYVRAGYRVTDVWTVFAGVSHVFGSVVDRYLLGAGVTFRW